MANRKNRFQAPSEPGKPVKITKMHEIRIDLSQSRKYEKDWDK